MAIMKPSSIAATIPFEKDGIHHGYLRLPHSRDDSAWGNLMIPICVVRNGSGPSALITGANHGDEYEGPLALVELAATIDIDQVSGTIIIVPFFNYPAFQVGRRTSPIDGGNMNRVFPGRPDGNVTEKIADYFQRELLPRAELVLDFHSGGRTLDFLPFAACHVLEDKQQEARCRAARDAFCAPWSIAMREIDSLGMYDDAAEALGKTFVTTELAGGGTSTPQSVAIARRGLRNILIHSGNLAGEPERQKSRNIHQPEGCFRFAQCTGMIEYLVNLGDEVKEGQPIGCIWNTSSTGCKPAIFTAPIEGILLARHFPGLVQMGDCIAVIGVEEISV